MVNTFIGLDSEQELVQSMAVNLVTMNGSNIVRHSNTYSIGQWDGVLKATKIGIYSIGFCSDISCPISRQDYYRENREGMQSVKLF